MKCPLCGESHSLEPKAEAWNDAGTKPDHPCLCETRFHELDTDLTFQMWNGIYFCEDRYDKRAAKLQTEKSINQHVQWREVQP